MPLMKVLTACTFAVPMAPRMAERTAIAIFNISCQFTLPFSGFGFSFLLMVFFF